MTPPAAAPDEELVVRPVRPEDRPAVIELCRSSLGWREGDPNEAFFEWKHDLNPFGPSPAWVATTAAGELVGLRVFLRWRFRRDGRTLDVVRAVDTATRPDHQGRGIFRRLTLGALPELTGGGTAAVFNTPNDQSRPGYLKMGWQPVGRVPVALRVAGPAGLARLRGARAAAEKWSSPTSVGLPAADALADTDAVARLLGSLGDSPGVRTDHTPATLHWRYSFEPLHYRVVPLGDRLEDGLVVFRVRRRGTATEATVCDEFVPPGRSSRRALAWLLRRSGADYALRCDWSSRPARGFLPAPGLGPLLVWRPLAVEGVPRPDGLALSLGDVELF